MVYHSAFAEKEKTSQEENTMAKYETLFTPFKIGSCEIRNRVIIPAMEGTNIVENMYGPTIMRRPGTTTSNGPRMMWVCLFPA